MLTVLDRRIDETAEMLLNVAAAESEHPTESALTDAVNELVAPLDRLVRLRAGIKALPR